MVELNILEVISSFFFNMLDGVSLLDKSFVSIETPKEDWSHGISG